MQMYLKPLKQIIKETSYEIEYDDGIIRFISFGSFQGGIVKAMLPEFGKIIEVIPNSWRPGTDYFYMDRKEGWFYFREWCCEPSRIGLLLYS